MPTTANTCQDCADIVGMPGIHARRRVLAEALQRVEDICHKYGLHEECSPCSGEQRSQCERQAVGELGEMIFLTFAHFTAEEKCMADIAAVLETGPLVDAHKNAHADLSSRFSKLVDQWNCEHPKSCIKQFAHHIQAWMNEHIDSHDIALQQLLSESRAAA